MTFVLIQGKGEFYWKHEFHLRLGEMLELVGGGVYTKSLG